MEYKDYPPLYDHHTHISFYSALSEMADLSDCTDEKSALNILSARHEKLILAKGWKDNLYTFSDEKINKLNPLIVCNISLHSFKFNKSAYDLLFVKYPEIINNLSNQNWIEHNLTKLFEMITDFGATHLIPKFIQSLESLGIHKADDMAVSSDSAAEYLGENFSGKIQLWAEYSIFNGFVKSKQYIHGIKLFADGALGARSAALLNSCKAGNIKYLLHSDEEMIDLLLKSAKIKKNIAVHAIGDAAIEQVIKSVEKAFANDKNIFVRLEHAQMINLKQALKAKKIGIVLSMQPNFSDDSVYYSDRLTSEYLKANNPFRILIDAAGFVPGKDLIFGSDGMPHGLIPAVNSSFNPPFLTQKLTKKEFIDGYSA